MPTIVQDIPAMKSRFRKMMKHSDNPQDFADIIQVCNDMLDKISRNKFHHEFDELKIYLWNMIFKSEDKLGITYDEPKGYRNYPAWVFHK